MSKINLCVIATAKYKQFLPQFLESAERFFLKGHDVHYCIFTDFLEEACLFVLEKGIDREVTYYKVEHKPWPHATIKRFHFFLQYKENLPQADYLFYCDVDSRFVAPIGDEILGNLTAVQHCGYCDGQNLPFETNEKSTAYVPKEEQVEYFGGGFWGFESSRFWNVASWGAAAIDIDEANGIVPVWHDESILNKFLSLMPPTVKLSPSYHWPQNNPHIWNKWAKQGLNFECKILLLDKKHDEIRK